MVAEVQDIEQELAELDARNSPQGLFERYARGRVSLFLLRQVLTVLGAAGVAILVSVPAGALLAALVILGDVFDCLYLARVPGLLARGVPFARLRRVSAFTGGVQAVTVSAAAAVTWFGTPDHPAVAVSLAFLMAAASNAAATLSYNPPATYTRLVIYAVPVPVLYFANARFFHDAHDMVLADSAAALYMGYVSFLFMQQVAQGRAHHLERSREMIVQRAELARANRDLEDSQKELRYLAQVAKHANDSVIVSRPDGRILWVNDAFTQITGYDLSEAVGQKPADLLNDPETSQETSGEITRAVAEGRPHRTQIQNRTKDGRLIWLGINLVPVFDDAGQVELVVAVERDITDIKAREAELARAVERAEQSEAAKAQFLAAMSHEIRTPMNGIIGMADLLSEADLNRENRQYVETIRHSGEALLTIINDILDFSKLRAGKPATHAVEFALRDAVDGVVMLLGPQARAKGLFIDVVAATPLPENVLGDDGRLRQILINILGNAIKFTPSGGVTLTMSCDSAEGGYQLGFAVQDTGIGIAPDRIDHVFDEFAQADAATTRQFGGTGLGLSISRLLAREMGGNVTVSSTLGEGSCFTVTVRFGKVSAPPERPPGPETWSPDAIAGKTILVAEDNKTNQLLLRKYLKDQSLSLHFAVNGREAIEMVDLHDPDIVLMDMAMPVMDGLTATRTIRRTHRRRPQIIALTANAFAGDKAACLNAGMDGFLTKPVRKGELLKVLARPGPGGPAAT